VSSLSLIEHLRKREVSLEDLVATALELFILHSNMKTKEKASKILKEEIIDALAGVNVSYVVARMLQGRGGCQIRSTEYTIQTLVIQTETPPASELNLVLNV